MTDRRTDRDARIDELLTHSHEAAVLAAELAEGDTRAQVDAVLATLTDIEANAGTRVLSLALSVWYESGWTERWIAARPEYDAAIRADGEAFIRALFPANRDGDR